MNVVLQVGRILGGMPNLPGPQKYVKQWPKTSKESQKAICYILLRSRYHPLLQWSGLMESRRRYPAALTSPSAGCALPAGRLNKTLLNFQPLVLTSLPSTPPWKLPLLGHLPRRLSRAETRAWPVLRGNLRTWTPKVCINNGILGCCFASVGPLSFLLLGPGRTSSYLQSSKSFGFSISTFKYDPMWKTTRPCRAQGHFLYGS